MANRLGLIGYKTSTGLGVMNHTLLEQFEFNAHLVIPHTDSLKEMKSFQFTAKNELLAKSWTPNQTEIDWLFDNSDTVITIETDYNARLCEQARKRDKRLVFIPMHEWFFHDRYANASIYLCTSLAGFDFVKFNNRIYIPWPIDTDKFKYKERGYSKGNYVFIHNAGGGGLNWRKGTIEAVKGFSLVKDSRIKLLIRTQKPLEQYPEDMLSIIKNDRRIIAETKDVINCTDLYLDGDVYLYPARYDGQALVAAEAMACGFPIFVTNASPMNEFSDDKRFMIKSNIVDTVKLKDHEVNLNVCDVNDLADKIRWSIDEDLTAVGKRNREIIEEHHSWTKWHDAYAKIFGVL